MASSTNTAAPSDALALFARKLAHDLNNFSTVVRTYSELLLADLPPESRYRPDVEEIHRASDAMVQYLQRVTRFARVGAMRRVPVDVMAGVVDAVETLRTEAPERAVRVEGSTITPLAADVLWWRDVLVELLRNAHEASPAGDTLVVQVAVVEGALELSVQDSGPGLPAELFNSVTAPFVTSKHGVRGAGLGLALVSAFVGSLQGSLTFSHGTTGHTVTLRLPLSTE